MESAWFPDALFTPATASWFRDAFPGGATDAQRRGWEAIGRGEHTLVCAPTGSGKTLAAFLVGIDGLTRAVAPDKHGVRLLYVSPLKALNYDIERNLRAPLAGIAARSDLAGERAVGLTVAVRTGDTPQRERQAMLRRPPDILITTPESLFLILTSPNARTILTDVDAVIIDEVHAVAATKRGAHLSLSLERLDDLRIKAGRPEVQRIALSATQRPLEEVARFVGGDRPVTIIDAGTRKTLELQVVVPLEDMANPPELLEGELETVRGDPMGNRSVWPAIYPALLELIEQHRTTLVFVNYRRLAERLALRLNELAEADVARAHHGSLSREARAEVEDLLKRGELRCLVATSSLELGIDMGAIDLVIQVESPHSVARGLQRVGRAGHSVGEPSRGRIFPKFRGDLVEVAVVAERMLQGLVEETRVPLNCLDVLAQQLVAMCAVEEWPVESAQALVRRAHGFRELPPSSFEGVLDMLSGRYPSDDFAELRPRIVWDRIHGVLRGRANARSLAVSNAGTIPDRGLYGVFLIDGSGRVGELDEEMVHEARPGQVFLLGASSWRIERITRDRVLVSPAPGQPGQVPFWRGDAVGRPLELGRALGVFTREMMASTEKAATTRLVERHALDEAAARNLLAYLAEQRAATGVLPTDRTIVVERFRDEIGDWRLAVLSPFGSRVHAPWALALMARLRDEEDIDVQALWSDDGIILHLPDADEPPSAELVRIESDTLEELVTRELSGSAIFGSRFRENAARALLIPRRRPGQRSPLWQQRLKAQALLQATEGYGSFPIVLETYRECMQDVFDLPGLREILAAVERREVSLVEMETPHGSPFAGSLLMDYIATYMYEGDAPAAERRAQALALDRTLLAELLGQDELRDLIDESALAQVAELLARRSSEGGADGLHDDLRRLGDLTPAEVGDVPAIDELVRARRAVRVRIAGEERVIAAEDAARYRDAVGTMIAAGLPDAFLEPVPRALRELVARYARTHPPFAAGDVAARLGVPEQRVADELAVLEEQGRVVHAALRPGGTGLDWCDAEVLRRVRRASLAVSRAEVEAVPQEAYARFLPRWHRIDEGGGGSLERLRDAIATLQGHSVPVAILERDVLRRRVPGYLPSLLDTLCASGEVVWVGAGESRVALAFREDAPLLGPPAAAPAPEGELADAIRSVLTPGVGLFFAELAMRSSAPAAELAVELWRLVWAGEVTNDAYAPLRAPRQAIAQIRPASVAGGRNRSRLRRRGSSAPVVVAGRWGAAGPLHAGASEAERARVLAEVALERYGVVTRGAARADGTRGGFSALYGELSALEVVGTCRRGYFVEGQGGAQFALPGAVERLRDLREPDQRSVEAVVLAAGDPAQPYGSILPWPAAASGRLSRASGAYVVLADGAPALYLERGGKSLVGLVDPASEIAAVAVRALVEAVAARLTSIDRLLIERADGRPVNDSPWEATLTDAGFRIAPKGLALGGPTARRDRAISASERA